MASTTTTTSPLPLAALATSYGKSESGASRRVLCKQLWIPPLETTKPSLNYGGSLPVLYTNDPEAAHRWTDTHIPEIDRPVVVGWDMESSPNLPWRKTIYEGPSTVQISVGDAAMVVQIAQEDTGPCLEILSFLQNFLSDPSILKAGVGIDQDMVELIRWPEDGSVVWKDVVGRLDIGGIGGRPGATQSLKTLASTICGVNLVKDKKLSRSNWARLPGISTRQIAYAARDAWVAAAVVNELARRDPRQFSTSALWNRILEHELPIQMLEEKAAARKAAKLQLQSVLGNGKDRIERKDLSQDQLSVVQELDERIKELAPPQPIHFDVGALGL